ncbi:MAG: sigma 54-interacting transcriptional regulator [Emergencia sp.]|nr:sigma 54-interacting transcriptional regulator [Emergencia sp.]
MYTGSIRRIRINGTPNRMGLIFLVLKAIADYGINIVTMESDPYICCKLEWNESISEEDFLDFMKKRVPEIDSITYIDLMEYERIEAELSTLLNNVDCAIIKSDASGIILSYNEKGLRLLRQGNRTISDLHVFLNDKCPELPGLTRHCEIEFTRKIEGKEKALYAELDPIPNEEGIITGYFLIIKEMANIRTLINHIIGPSMITFDSILGESRQMQQTIALAKSVARSEASIMIRGESGTGKELFARAIHMESPRAEGPFVAVNCASIPETLIESEFFGYEKGSFTGASASGKQGYFEQATGGTLFLDEIGELATHLQAKILRALQERKIRRIGGKNEIDIDVRVISATHRNLEEMIEGKSFREDLYYRLNIIPIFVPALRERKSDIAQLASYFVRDICEKNGKKLMEISPEAMDKLISFSWPGNVRELNNVLERAVFMAEGQIQSKDILLDARSRAGAWGEDGGLPAEVEAFPVDLPGIVRAVENRYIDRAMKAFGSYRKAAQNLNISHTSIINKVRALEGKRDE